MTHQTYSPVVEDPAGLEDLEDRISVLMIDDDPDDVLIVRDLLADIPQQRYRLDWAASYEEGLELLRQWRYAVCLVDYYLGAHDGLDVLKMAAEYGIETPMIMLTGQGSLDIDRAAMKAGATDYLVKSRLDAQLLERVIRYSIERASLLRQLNHLARSDALTGLLNVREFHRILSGEVARSQRYAQPVTLAMLDIDLFKTINDTFGHTAGDAILRAVARILVTNLRATDRPSRYGGDELAIVMPGQTAHQARLAMQRVCTRLAKQTFAMAMPSGDSTDIRVTLSIGLAEYPRDADSKDALIRAADRALYAAKHRGRDQIIEFVPSP